MPSPKTPKRKKMQIEGREVLLEAVGHIGMGLGGSGWWHATSSYSVQVDGIPRGFVCYGYGRNRTDPGWRGYVFGVSFTGNGSEPRLQATKIRSGASRDEVAAMFVDLTAKDLAPTIEEATAAVERKAVEIAAEQARRLRDRDEDRLKRQAAKEQAASDLDEMTEGLRSIRERLSADLTNFEADAIERVIARLIAEKEPILAPDQR